jgi:hypothetical protein
VQRDGIVGQGHEDVGLLDYGELFDGAGGELVDLAEEVCGLGRLGLGLLGFGGLFAGLRGQRGRFGVIGVGLRLGGRGAVGRLRLGGGDGVVDSVDAQGACVQANEDAVAWTYLISKFPMAVALEIWLP